MSIAPMNRRTFLRAAGVSIGLPLLDAMLPIGIASSFGLPPTRVEALYAPFTRSSDRVLVMDRRSAELFYNLRSRFPNVALLAPRSNWERIPPADARGRRVRTNHPGQISWSSPP